AHVQAALYRGDAEKGWQLWTAHSRAIVRSQLLRVQWTRIEAAYGRARCALMVAMSDRTKSSFLSMAADESARIRRERMAWSSPIADLIDAAIAIRRGYEPLARRLLLGAVDAFDRNGMGLYAAAARRRLSMLVGDGARYVRDADAWMSGEGIVNPARM